MTKPLEDKIDCPCCDGRESRFWASEAGYTVVRCADCALLFVNPRPRTDYIDQAVRTGIHTFSDDPISVRNQWIGSKLPYYRQRMAPILADVTAAGRPVRWVDVGSGHGEFIEALGGVLPAGSEITGVEPMTYKADTARSRGLSVVNGYLTEGMFQADIISNIDVFSHIPDYRSFLRTVASNLKPGGQLLIETGNLADVENRNDVPFELGLPDHLVFAGRKSMEMYLESAGFQIAEVVALRADTIGQMLKNFIKLAIGRTSRVGIPYTSDYRQLIIRAKLVE
jgi:2-polyprenyl-3-methyl-5-hydroxy-6-metoxy-1,4-benzoquinol methylase